MMNPFPRIGGPAPVPGFGRPKVGGGGMDYGPMPASPTPAPWKKKPTFTETASLYSYADPGEQYSVGADYAKMVGEQTEAFRKQQAMREKALQNYAGDFQSRYGQEMPEEFKSAYTGAAPTLGRIQSFRDFAANRGWNQVGRSLASGVPPGIKMRLGSGAFGGVGM
jgi:hypothetical protein